MRRLVAFLALVGACGEARIPGPGLVGPQTAGFAERFAGSSVSLDWLVVAPEVAGAQVRVKDGALALVMPAGSSGELIVRRKVDASPLRGQRVRLAVRARTEAPPASFARARVTATTGSGQRFLGDSASTRAVHACYGVGYVIRVEVAEVIAVGAAKVIGQEVAKVIAGIGPTTRGSATRGRPN